jgi:hypothetical protein
MSHAIRLEDKALKKIQAEVFEENGVSLGSYVTEGEDRLIIGSSQRADLVVPHNSISQIHAMLRIVGDNDILLYDLGSDGGTFVGGKKIIERRLNAGEFFEIGGHRVKVNLLEQQNGQMDSEKALFWKPGLASKPDFVEMIRLEDGLVHEERTLSTNGRIIVGRRKNEMFVDGAKAGSAFLHRKDSSGAHTVDCFLPTGFVAEIYDANNELVRLIEQGGANFSFNASEKARLFTADLRREILIYYRSQGNRGARTTQDAESPAMQKAAVICASIAALLLAVVSYVPLKREALEETLIPKSSYTRTTMAAAPAPAAPAAAAASSEAQSSAPASKATSISSTLAKMLNKKSTLTAESVQQAISKNGTQTSRDNSLKSANIKSEEIAAGAVGGGAMNVNAMSAGLAGGSGKAGKLGGFAGGKVGGVGAASGFGGKNFDMSLGGEDEEAIGGLDKSLIAAVVQANIGQIKHCYERQLIVDPNIVGKVVAGWTIDKEGRVSSTSVKKSTMNSKPVENCILGKIKTWAFPKPKGGGQVLVSYPFLFKSLN